jgi:DNA-binding response OmpR family regulator
MMAMRGLGSIRKMVMLDAEDVVQLLHSKIERAGGPSAFSRKARVDRAVVHRFLKRQAGPSKRIISSLDLRVVYTPKAKDGAVPTQGSNIIEIRSATGLKDGKPRLFINGKSVKAPRAQVALVACLYNELGCVVPYKRLCRVIGHQSSQDRQLRLLRQYMQLIRRMLATHKARCFLAVSAGLGYALCEVAQG